ncbi:hypothetical protein Dsin_028986 [Dipteronia sinensis]|uniref:Endonuclease/exonuclease/phosphatase n=1 Tax=Dipteronia sinensis TaxID=43782 RepID=A0AAD9ZS94_9ROSI|nr:hypothetical protein Dsin_028986 [Dipteronia sinensis]
MSDFREALEDANLKDMGYIGAQFIWSNKRDAASIIMERLDKGLCNSSWKTIYPQFVICHLEFWGSDHRPLVLEFPDDSPLFNSVKKGRWFFFEECWVDDTYCKKIVESAWKVEGNNSKVRKCA